ncbi:MAG: 50S ribosomal protein L6 [Armatimonadetes bacterium]|nr:50S ribosomal protein L6 [Armatimonadota bacterium]
MSRIGAKPIVIPPEVTVQVGADNRVAVKGPRGELEESVSPDLQIVAEGALIRVERPTEQTRHRSQHGLARTLINNMIIGVSQGYEKALELHGVGYRASLEGKDLVLSVGFSHTVRISPPEGIQFEIGKEDRSRIVRIVVRGISKQQVGQVAADVRKVKKPDVYKGKGIRYKGEQVKLRQGKRAVV